jgi:hypothetical protein
METTFKFSQFIKIIERIKIFSGTTSDPIKERLPLKEAFTKYKLQALKFRRF